MKKSRLLPVCLLLYCLLPASAKAQPRRANLEAMQGIWQSEVDKNAWLLVKDSDFVVFYKSSLSLDKGRFVKRDSCCKRCEYFTVKSQGEINCYELLEANEAKLSYSFANRGDTHSYARRTKMPKAMKKQMMAMED